MNTYEAPYQGKQTVVASGDGFPQNYQQVNTYMGSQRGWMIKAVPPEKVEQTKREHLGKLGAKIANYEVVCTNPDMRVYATAAYLTKKLTHGGNLQ